MMDKQFAKIRLTCLTPTHVGSGEILNASQYIYDRANDIVYFLDEKKWRECLSEYGRLSDFTDALVSAVSNGKFFSIFDWTERNLMHAAGKRRMDDLLEQLHKEGVILGVEEAELVSQPGSIREVRALTRDSLGKYYIPGSGLKGSFRTAILAKYIEKDKKKFFGEWRRIEQARGKRDWESVAKELENKITVQPNTKGKYDAVGSFLRGLSVSDAVMEKGELGIIQKLYLGDEGAVKGVQPKYLSMYMEALLPKAEFTFTVSLNPELMKNVGISSVRDLLKAAGSFMDFQYGMLEPLYAKGANGEVKDCLEDMKSAHIQIGAGTGYISKTLAYPLAPSPNRAVTEVKKLMMEQFRRNQHQFDRRISPRSLKMTQWGGNLYLMGLCSLKILEEKQC